MNKNKIKKILEENKFPGFPPFNDKKGKYWQYPKIMEHWWYVLNGSEQKCLDFMLRRTWGFRKEEDAISESQFMNGVKNFDQGTGLSKNAMLDGVKGLVEKGFIELAGLQGDIKKYRLVLETNSGAVQVVNNDSAENEHLDSAKNEQIGGSVSEHTIEDITIKDITIDNIQTIYTVKKEVIPLYIPLVMAIFREKINHSAGFDKYSYWAIYQAMKTYRIRAILKAIINKANDYRWMESNSHLSIVWFLQDEKRLKAWISENSKLDYSPWSYEEITNQIKTVEGEENLKIIFPEWYGAIERGKRDEEDKKRREEKWQKEVLEYKKNNPS
ncbi:MAG: hypothetical protein Q8O13_00375 [Candidatus Omnitrophota bacterium]|nr:hypothetical protein [Candidatus Omnitrophota bacterium]